MDISTVLQDLLDEQNALDEIIAALDDADWELPTPSPGWTVGDQIGHLTYFDATAAQAITDPDGFKEGVARLFGQGLDVDEVTLGAYRRMSAADRLDAWRTNRRLLAEAAATLSNDDRVPWYGPSMGSKSFLTARLMECWAHGQDVVDTVGVDRPGSDRLRHVAQIGFITRGWSYANRGETAPEAPVRVELTSPTGEVWTFGPPEATETVTGDAVDFCLVVTQRRHVDDTGLEATPVAREWLERAQAFAGPPTDGPKAS
ncbi:MAG: TIGR03084 family metal-binding protein [Acidimicrobiales bacterium]|nr:TIGR03084 family protein [Acidimicrobiales bacterium]